MRLDYVALHIKAEVMHWVYASGSAAKPRKRTLPTVEQQTARKAVSSGFFSSLFSSFTSPQRPSTPVPPPLTEAEISRREKAREAEEREKEDEERKRLLAVNETSVTLAVFGAEVEVRLDERMKKEMLRATKKNPPTHMRVELIYVRLALIACGGT
jgi:hypothetical protein